MNEHYDTIEIISRRIDMPAAAVRRYTRLGYVVPRAWRGRTPLYGEAEVARLRKIARLTRHLGLNGPGVEVVPRLTDEIQRLRRALASRREEDQ